MARAPEEGAAAKRKPSTSTKSASAKSDALLKLLPPQVLQDLQQPWQPGLLGTPAPSSVIDINPRGPAPTLLKQEKPVAVELTPKKPPVRGRWHDTEGELLAGINDAMSVEAGKKSAGQQQAEDHLAAIQNQADQYNMQARLGARDAARRAREKADRQETAVPLTQKQWNALTPLQQASAQANADLAAAIERDFKTQGEHKNDWQEPGGNERIKKYQDRVKALFGEDNQGTGVKGLEYAPNTIAFLDKRGIEASDLVGVTLDDIVLGDTLVGTDTLKDLAEKVKSPDVFHTWPTDPREKNIAFAQNLAKGQLEYQEKLANTLKKGDKLIADITGRDTSLAASSSYGAKGLPSQMKLDAVRPEMLQQMDVYLQALARTDSPLDQALTAINTDMEQRGASDEEARQVYAGLVEHTRQASQGQVPWFDKVDFPMRAPDEVAAALGAPVLKRAAKGVAK